MPDRTTKAILAVASAMLFAIPAHAAGSHRSASGGGVCRQIDAELLADEKQLGYLTAQTVGQDTAMGQAAVSTATTALYAEIASQKSELRSHGCPVYPHAISPRNFANSAMQCDIADLQEKLAHPSTDPVEEMMDKAAAAAGHHPSDTAGGVNPCDRSRWKR